jgi:hypothetical protein
MELWASTGISVELMDQTITRRTLMWCIATPTYKGIGFAVMDGIIHTVHSLSSLDKVSMHEQLLVT